MNTLLSVFLTLLIFSIISVQLTSSASFPNPPSFPQPNASAHEWSVFWKLLHNYYAIIARPRFGKRYDRITIQRKHPSVLGIINSNDVSSSSSSSSENPINIGDLYTLMDSNRRRR